jgi:hypothetical protein
MSANRPPNEAELWNRFKRARAASRASRAIDDPLVHRAWLAWVSVFEGQPERQAVVLPFPLKRGPR